MATEKEVRWENQSVVGNLKEIKDSINTIAEGIEFLKTNTGTNTIATVEKKEVKEDEVIPIESIVEEKEEMINDIQEVLNKPLYTIIDKEIGNAFMENGMARSVSLSSDQIRNISTTRGMVK